MGKTFNTGTLVNGVTVLSNGNVGIAINNPSYLLQVQNGDIAIGNGNQTSGNFSQAQSLHFLNEGTSPLATIKAIRTNWAQGQTDLVFYTYNSVISERLRITSSGYVGIGFSSPQQRLHVQDNSNYTAINIVNVKMSSGGTSAIQFGLHDAAFNTYDASRIEARIITNPDSALDFKVYSSSLNTVMSLLGNGRIGIGITNPAVSLDIGSRTDAIMVTKGTTAQRPSATSGLLRHNTSLQSLEYHNGTNWLSLIPDGSTAANAVTNLTQFDSLGKPAGVYWFSPPGYSLGAIQLYYDSSLQSLGVGWVQVFSSPFKGSATVNEIDKNLPVTQILVRTSDGVDWATAGWNNGVYRRFVTRGNASDAATDLTTTGTKTGFRVYFGYAGGHGIYNTSQEVCSWSNSTGAIGAGYDGSCGSYPNNLVWGLGNSTPNYTTINKTWHIWIRW